MIPLLAEVHFQANFLQLFLKRQEVVNRVLFLQTLLNFRHLQAEGKHLLVVSKQILF